MNLTICQACGRHNDPDASFCEDCGGAIAPGAEANRAPRVEAVGVPVGSVVVHSAPLAKTADEREFLLSQKVAQMAGQGYRIESQSDFVAVMVSGRRVNHLLHFFIGVFTLGLWWVVWIILALAGGERRQVLSVDVYGNVVVGRQMVG